MGVAQNSSVHGGLGMMLYRRKGNVTWPWEGMGIAVYKYEWTSKVYLLDGIGQKRGAVQCHIASVCVCVFV